MSDESKGAVNKFREAGEKIKAEVAAGKEAEKAAGEQAMKDLATVSASMAGVSPDVANFYKQNAGVGAENLGGASMPQLKVTEGNSNNEGADGQLVAAGNFFY